MAFIDRWFDRQKERMQDRIVDESQSDLGPRIQRIVGYVPGEYKLEGGLLDIAQNKCNVPSSAILLTTMHNMLDRAFSRVIPMNDPNIQLAEVDRRMSRLREMLIKYRR